MNPPPEVHRAAAAGFEREAGRYTRGRPDYPEALLDWLRETLRLGPGSTVADVGAGTGKFTRLLQATGARVIAVEPVAAMRAQLAAALPQVQTVDAPAQSLPFADGSLDAVVCAQAFHWFATVEALTSFHRVLAPGGRLGLIWNVRDESVDWVRAITDLITPYEGDAPRFHKGTWRTPFALGGFTPLAESRFPHRHTGNAREVIIDRFMSVSFIAALPPAEQADVQQRLQALIDGDARLRGDAIVEFPYLTCAFVAIREPLPPSPAND